MFTQNSKMDWTKIVKIVRLGVFQQDNDLRDTSKALGDGYTKCWRVSQKEHQWKVLKTAFGRRSPSNLTDLEPFSEEEWSNIPEVSCKLIYGCRKGQIYFFPNS